MEEAVVDMPAQPAAPALLARVAAGDRAAMRDCLQQYARLVWSIARRFEVGDAEDAVQEIFLEVWKSAARYDAALGTEAVFVATIARRRLIDRRRTRARRPTTEAIEVDGEIAVATAGAGGGPERSAEAQQAARALAKLRPEQQRVLVMAACHGMSHGEIAEETGMPLGTVKAHARRGLMSIRSALLGVPEEERA